MKKGENFYRRDPSKALSGMIGLSLEERGVYNTIIDLLYSTWRPLEDDRPFIANWCGAAVQKINPIVNRLIEKGRLIAFVEGGRSYLSDEAFEAECAAVKGPAKTRSGRGEVGEKSAGVEEKSAGVGQNPLLLDAEIVEKQSVAALEKRREEKKEAKASSVAGGDVGIAFELWNELAGRLGLPVAKTLTPERRKAIKARLADAGLLGWGEALLGVERSRHCRGENDRSWKADLDFVCQAKSYQRLREGFYGLDAPSSGPAAPAAPWSGPADLRARVVSAAGEDFARGYLDPCAWREAPDRALVAPNTFTAGKLRTEVGRLLDQLGVAIRAKAGEAVAA